MLRFIQQLLVGVGVVTLAYVGGTLAYAGIYQQHQSWQFDQAVAEFQANATERTGDLKAGDLVGRLEVPRIGVSVMVHHGVEEHILTVGAGHVPATPLPGAQGNAVIAGHRDTFFRKLEGILPGDIIEVSTVGGTHQYVVDSTTIVQPEDTQVMESRGRPELTLITCYPFYFVGNAPQRFIVHSSRVD